MAGPKIPGHESAYPLEEAARLLRLTKSGLVQRMTKYGVSTLVVQGEKNGWVRAADMPKLIAARKVKSFFSVAMRDGRWLAVPNPNVAGTSAVFLTKYQRQTLIVLWRYVRGLGGKRYGWNAFLSQLLAGCPQFYYDKIKAGDKFWLNWKTQLVELEKKGLTRRHVATRRWPSPVSIPQWLLKEEFKRERDPGGAGGRGVRRAGAVHAVDSQTPVDGEEDD